MDPDTEQVPTSDEQPTIIAVIPITQEEQAMPEIPQSVETNNNIIINNNTASANNNVNAKVAKGRLFSFLPPNSKV